MDKTLSLAVKVDRKIKLENGAKLLFQKLNPALKSDQKLMSLRKRARRMNKDLNLVAMSELNVKRFATTQ